MQGSLDTKGFTYLKLRYIDHWLFTDLQKEETHRFVSETEKTVKGKQQQLEKAQQAYNSMAADLGGKVKESEVMFTHIAFI